MPGMKRMAVLAAALLLASSALADIARRKVVIDQDSWGPGGTNMNAILLALLSPDVDVLGVTVESGDGWQRENVAHALRMLELVGRSDVPVVPGAVYPLLNSAAGTRRWEERFGRIAYKGAWSDRMPDGSPAHEPDVVPPMPEGSPATAPSSETAAEFLVRCVRRYPHQVAILALGPMTNLALAARLGPDFPGLAESLVFAGGSLGTRREFNIQWDPEAARIILHAAWARIVIVPTDVTSRVKLPAGIRQRLAGTNSPAAKYFARYSTAGECMWDEVTVAVWLDPRLVLQQEKVAMDVDTDAGASGYGLTRLWPKGQGPGLGEPEVNMVRDVDVPGFERLFSKVIGAAELP